METITHRTVGVGIIGLGTVGGGVARLIERNRALYRDAYGIDLHVTRACARHPERAVELGLDKSEFTTDWRTVTACPDVDIVVELIGGTHPAREIMEDAFAHGKHVVSANKALLGAELERLADAARVAGVGLRYEASCAGGIPIIDTLERGLAANDIRTIAGIVNGTTNYILSRMDAEGLGFDEVLADAQRLGYAEADPTADVDGLDAAAKLAILSSLAFHGQMTSNDVRTQGIRTVDAADITWARGHGYRIKLLAVGRVTPTGVELRVHPALIPAEHMLASVSGAMNAICVIGDAVGETMFYGAGAGSLPTASAVVADILALAHPDAHASATKSETQKRTCALAPIDELKSRFYVRAAPVKASVDNNRTEGVSATTKMSDVTDAVRACLHERDIEIGGAITVTDHEAMFTTGNTTEAILRDALDQLEEHPAVERVANVIRIEDTAAWTQA